MDRYAKRMQRVVDFMESHLDEPMDVERLSRVANFSRFHFHRQFTAWTGLPVARFVQILRLKQAARRLAVVPGVRVTDVALESGFDSPEAFSRAFRKLFGTSPSDFRRHPHWDKWWTIVRTMPTREQLPMKVEIVRFPETPVAALEHRGPEHLLYETTRSFITWRQRMGISPASGDTYGLHYADATADCYRFDICVSYKGEVGANPEGVVSKRIPGGRCARVRHLGSREHIPAADALYRQWLPQSGMELRDFPFFFHYVNVGSDVRDADMITDLYLPLAG